MKFVKGHSSVKSVGGVIVLVQYTPSDALYFVPSFAKVSDRVSVSDLDSRVDTRVVANVEGWIYRLMYEQTENWIPILGHA